MDSPSIAEQTRLILQLAVRGHADARPAPAELRDLGRIARAGARQRHFTHQARWLKEHPGFLEERQPEAPCRLCPLARVMPGPLELIQ